MKTTHVMSLVAATVFAIGVAGPALAQTPATPAPATTPAPAKSDTQMDKMDKKGGKAMKHARGKKRHASAKKVDKAAAEKRPETKAPDTKAPDQPKK
jgi:hypothetical protein